MHATHIDHGADQDGADRLGGALFWASFGAIVAAVAWIGDMLLDAMAIGIVQIMLDIELCTGAVSTAGQVAMLCVAVVTSIVVALVIWLMGRQVGAKASPGHEAWGRHIRRSFLIPALGLYIAAAPLNWLLILGFSNC